MQMLNTEVTVLNDSTVDDGLTAGCNNRADVSNHKGGGEGSELMQCLDVQATL